MIIIYFDLQHRNPWPEVCESINRIYNEYLSPFDYREPCYRYLIVAAANPRLSLELLDESLQAPRESPEGVARAEGVLLEAFRAVDSRACDALRRAGDVLQRVNAELYASVVERDHIIVGVQAELHQKVAERDMLIRDLQQELHAGAAQRDQIIRDLQRKVAQLQAVAPPQDQPPG